MDEHFRSTPWSENLPVLMALVGVWNNNFLKIPTLAILPYTERLARFPAFLQQLEMESNGKSVTHDGSRVLCETAPIVWGSAGNDGQHSFYQLLHQGTLRAAMDFILVQHSPIGLERHQRLANVHALAQVEAFAMGEGQAINHRWHQGGRPQSLLMLDELSPESLGSLIALYEHKVYTQSMVWGVNAFDQFGVELGKRHCTEMLRTLDAGVIASESTVAPWLLRNAVE
jgi:glucose-6-phosphate isomerase